MATVWTTETKASSYSSPTQISSTNMIRLVEDPDIVKNIKFDEISILDDGVGNNNGDNVERAGVSYPIIRINDVILKESDIKHFKIESSGFVPTINVLFTAYGQSFSMKNMPKDGDIISTYIRTTTSEITYLRNEFVITSCEVREKGAINIISVSGKLFIPKLLSKNNAKSIIGTSKTVMKEIAKENNLGFAFNDFDDTNDFQNWLCCRESYVDFLNNVTMHSWKDNRSFFKSWVDLYYNICYVNVNKFLLSSENSESEMDITFNSNTRDIANLISINTNSKTSTPVVKLFTNMVEYAGTPFHIIDFKPINNAFNISMNTGYQSNTFTFKHNQYIYNKDSNDCFETLKNYPAYDKNKTDSYIILRGRTKYEKDKNPEYEQERINYNYTDTYITSSWTGIEYVLDDDVNKEDTNNNKWSGNVHPNYNRAYSHNKINIDELNKLYIQITCEGLCLQVLRGERVPVYLVLNNFDDAGMKSQTTGEGLGFNKFYSGYYIVDNMEYNYSHSGGINKFTTTFTLKRREWPTPVEISKPKNS